MLEFYVGAGNTAPFVVEEKLLMDELLIKKPVNKDVTKEQFAEDIRCLFKNLKELYGMYDFYGEERFHAARLEVEKQIEGSYTFDTALAKLKKELSFVKDGHFYVGEQKENTKLYDYAIRYTEYKGIPVIDCKKFYSDNKEEKQQLIDFEKIGNKYKNDDALIIDLRGNVGGSSVHIYNFLEGLLGQEVGFHSKYLQRCTKLFKDFLIMNHIDWTPEEKDVVIEEPCLRIQNQKQIYVLIDERTASAAEEGVAVLKNIENVTIVGNHTAGCVSCGNCITIYMPNSHFKAYFGTGLCLYEGTRNIDAEGGFRGDISFEKFEKLIS